MARSDDDPVDRCHSSATLCRLAFPPSVESRYPKREMRPLVTARQIGMYVFRELTDYSYPKIAEEFGGRDHTTVMHACEKIRGQMAEKRVVFEQVNDLISRIKHGASG